MICKRCNASIPDDSKFCTNCGSRVTSEVGTSGGFAFKKAGDLAPSCANSTEKTAAGAPQKIYITLEDTRRVTLIEEPSCEKVEVQAPSAIDYVALGITIVAFVLWLVGPFEAVNLLTLNNQPTALELLQSDVWYLGDISDSKAYQAALASIVGIAVCFICVLAKSKNLTRIVAAGALIPLLMAFIEWVQWMDDIEDLTVIFGAGYWGVVICLLVLLFRGGYATKSS